MFIRKNKNRSGSISIQIIQKVGRQNKVIKTVGFARTKREEDLLVRLARNEMDRIQGLQSLFFDHDDEVVNSFVDTIPQKPAAHAIHTTHVIHAFHRNTYSP